MTRGSRHPGPDEYRIGQALVMSEGYLAGIESRMQNDGRGRARNVLCGTAYHPPSHAQYSSIERWGIGKIRPKKIYSGEIGKKSVKEKRRYYETRHLSKINPTKKQEKDDRLERGMRRCRKRNRGTKGRAHLRK